MTRSQFTTVSQPKGLVFVLSMGSTLIPEGTDPEQIVKLTMFVLQAHHQREAERLSEILSGIDELYIHKLAALWEELLKRYGSQGEALSVLTKIIAAELDGGDAPMVDSSDDGLAEQDLSKPKNGRG